MENQTALNLKAIIINNAYTVGQLDEVPPKGTIIARPNFENNDLKYYEVRGHRPSNKKILIRNFNTESNPPTFMHSYYINYIVIPDNKIKCESNFDFVIYPRQDQNPMQIFNPLLNNIFQNIYNNIIQQPPKEIYKIPPHIKQDVIKSCIKKDCNICLCEIEKDNINLTDCGHFFCVGCVGVWLETHDDCPTCRYKIK
jgi:hypothetical protein